MTTWKSGCCTSKSGNCTTESGNCTWESSRCSGLRRPGVDRRRDSGEVRPPGDPGRSVPGRLRPDVARVRSYADRPRPRGGGGRRHECRLVRDGGGQRPYADRPRPCAAPHRPKNGRANSRRVTRRPDNGRLRRCAGGRRRDTGRPRPHGAPLRLAGDPCCRNFSPLGASDAHAGGHHSCLRTCPLVLLFNPPALISAGTPNSGVRLGIIDTGELGWKSGTIRCSMYRRFSSDSPSTAD